MSTTATLTRKLWTRTEYERFVRLGAFDPEQRLELIEGEIVEKTPQNVPHATAIVLCTRLLSQKMGADEYLRVQLPLAVGERSLPEPDFAIVRGDPRGNPHHPEVATLVIEVSDSTLLYDRTTKARIYARALVPEYWILNLNERVLEVYLTPVKGAYSERRNYAETESVLLNGQSIAVKDLLP